MVAATRGGVIPAGSHDDEEGSPGPSATGPPDDLARVWQTLTSQLGGDEAAAQGVLAELDGRYREGHRAYHTWSHVRHVHEVLTWMTTRMIVDEPATVLAVFFHDAVYDPRAEGNESASADLARTACALMDLPDALGNDVHRLVLSTRDHRAGARDEAVLCDADLAILASDPATYDVYRRAVRVEYGHLDDDTFRQGRARLLEGFLDRPRIFATSLMRDRAESAARANIRREIDELRA